MKEEEKKEKKERKEKNKKNNKLAVKGFSHHRRSQRHEKQGRFRFNSLFHTRACNRGFLKEKKGEENIPLLEVSCKTLIPPPKTHDCNHLNDS